MKKEAEPRAYKQVVRAQTRERRREALLDAAIAEFFAGRWEQASLERVAARAGVTKQTLLRHFGSKEGLMEQAVLRGRGRVRDQRWAAPTDDVSGAVDNLLDHYTEWGEHALRLVAAGDRSPVLSDMGREGRKLHYEWVDHVFGRLLGDLQDPARVRRRAALIALCDVHTWWLLSNDLGLSRGDLHTTLTEAVNCLLRKGDR